MRWKKKERLDLALVKDQATSIFVWFLIFDPIKIKQVWSKYEHVLSFTKIRNLLTNFDGHQSFSLRQEAF